MVDKDQVKEGIGLALSGGGFRATLFHLGALWRINELGLLRKITRICSVSGGSITAGVLGHRWRQLTFDDKDVATNFDSEIADPLRHFCSLNIDVSAGVAGILSLFKSISDMVAAKYREHLFGDSTLQDLPDDTDGPHFVIYATSLQTGVSVRLSRPYMADYRIGMIRNPVISLASAITASSAFPPFLSPCILRPVGTWEKTEGSDLFEEEKYQTEMILTDGGVYDNLGLEAVWNDYKTVLVSDAGAPLRPETKQSALWHSQLLRSLSIMSEQTRALRKRRLVEDFIRKERQGAYWGIKTQINHYQLPDAMVTDNFLTASLCSMRTRLNKFTDEEQGLLINWGYALADAALRRHLPLPPGITPGEWPAPQQKL